MTIDAANAARAYAQIADVTAGAPRAGETPPSERSNFSALVADAVQNVEANLQASDAAATSVAAGEANLVDVVTAVSAAEVTLETAVAVRNRMIEAYQEILRMPI